MWLVMRVIEPYDKRRLSYLRWSLLVATSPTTIIAPDVVRDPASLKSSFVRTVKSFIEHSSNLSAPATRQEATTHARQTFRNASATE